MKFLCEFIIGRQWGLTGGGTYKSQKRRNSLAKIHKNAKLGKFWPKGRILKGFANTKNSLAKMHLRPKLEKIFYSQVALPRY